MSLLYIYVGCLIFGGVFVLLSVFSGFGEGDAELEAGGDADIGGELDFDADFDADVDVDGGEVDLMELPFEFDVDGADGEAGGGTNYEVSTQRRFNPLVSFKFYTFALAFFGLTGVVFTGLNIWSSVVGVLGLSLGMGLFAGLSVSYLMHVASSGGNDGITERDYLGASGEVTLPITARRAGKIRMRLKGRTIEMRAESAEDDHEFERGEQCFVLGLDEQVVKVIRAETVQKQLME